MKALFQTIFVFDINFGFWPLCIFCIGIVKHGCQGVETVLLGSPSEVNIT